MRFIALIIWNKARASSIIIGLCAAVRFHIIFMFDNFVEENYHPSDLVYTHAESGNHIFIGDAQAALDLPFLK